MTLLTVLTTLSKVQAKYKLCGLEVTQDEHYWVKHPSGCIGSRGGGYTIENSLRLRSSASAYLSRTPATAGNRKTWTWSAWIKRGKQGVINYIFGSPATYSTAFRFQADGKFYFTGVSGTQFDLRQIKFSEIRLLGIILLLHLIQLKLLQATE